MRILTPEHALSTLLRLQPQLAPVAYEVVRQIVSLFDISGQTTVAKVLERCYGDKSAAAATKAFERLREAVNEAAQTLGDSIRLEVDSRKSLGDARAVYFWGEPAVAVHAVADELAAVNQAGAMIEQQGRWLIEGPPRVVVLTVSPNEQSGLYQIFSPKAAPKTVEHQGYRYDDFGEIGNYRVLHINCEMGGLSIAIRAMRVIDAWKPILIVALGMAFGVDQKTQKLGDVLIASVVQAYELQRLTSGQPPEMRDSATRCAESWLQQLRLQKGHWRHSAMSMPELHFGKVLSGQKLLADAKKRDKYIRQTGGDAIGGEMEGFGLAEVCSDRRIDWLLIKGIADWGDVDKPKGEAKRRIQHDASLNAAKVLLALLDPNSAAAAFAASDALSHVPCADAKDFSQIEKLIENNARRVGLNADQLNANAPTQDAVNAFEQLTRWVQDPVAPAHFALLGEYGMGKTVLCQRLCEYLTEQRAAGIALPRPLYFDLRRMPARNDERVPSLEDTLEGCVTYGWLSAPGTAKPSVDQLKRWVTEGALVVFDGLDEILVHLSAANGQQYTSQLLRLLDLPRNDKQPAPKMLLSCRSHFFKSLSEQRAMLMERGRSKLDAQQFEALLLLPFTDAQIEDYLKSALPNLDSAQAMATIRAVHNVSELAARPYLLKEVARLMPRLEQWRMEGRKVQGVTVYREMVREWLMRDQGKHQIAPEHKLLVARDLAAELWAGGSRMIDASALSSWYFRWRQAQADAQLRYSDIHPDKLDEDLRNSQFLVREDAEDEKYSGFRFAHSSMQEYFLAEYLLQALRDNAPERWAIKGPSVETLVFFGQLLTEHADENLLSTLSRWRAPYQKQVSELYLHYALMAYERNWPQPSLHGLDMRGAKLRRISFGQKPQAGQPRLALEYALFDGAALTDCRFHSVRLNGAQFVGADLSGASLIECAIEAASFDRADLSGTVFRRCVGLESTDSARLHRTQWHTTTRAAKMRPILASLTAFQGHSNHVNACQLSTDASKALSASSDNTLRLWDTATGETLRVFRGHSDRVTACQLSLDASKALSASDDKTMRLWDPPLPNYLSSKLRSTGDKERCMKKQLKYTQERRELALQRVALRTDSQTIESIAALVDVNVGTLKSWMKAAKKQSANTGLNKPSSAYTPPQQLDALLETSKLSNVEVSAWCREKGLFPHDLSAWRHSLTAPRSDESAQLREVRRERDKFRLDLERKNKALAETAALLVLQKKFQEMFSDAAQ